MDKRTANINYKDYHITQHLLPLYDAIELRKEIEKDSGQITDIKSYELILDKCLDNEYSIDDFENVKDIDIVIKRLMFNQNKHLLNGRFENIDLKDDEILFWLAVRSGLVDYQTAKQMYADEIIDVVRADIFFKQKEADAIKQSTK